MPYIDHNDLVAMVKTLIDDVEKIKNKQEDNQMIYQGKEAIEWMKSENKKTDIFGWLQERNDIALFEARLDTQAKMIAELQARISALQYRGEVD